MVSWFTLLAYLKSSFRPIYEIFPKISAQSVYNIILILLTLKNIIFTKQINSLDYFCLG